MNRQGQVRRRGAPVHGGRHALLAAPPVDEIVTTKALRQAAARRVEILLDAILAQTGTTAHLL